MNLKLLDIRTHTTLDNINNGEIFMKDDELYMKVNTYGEIYDEYLILFTGDKQKESIENKYSAVVDLRTGHLCVMGYYDKVVRVNGEFVETFPDSEGGK